MGETGCDLSKLFYILSDHFLTVAIKDISPISYSVDGGVTFAPTAKTPITFDTPIEQLASVPHRPGRPVSSLVVRTMTSTTLLHIDETRGTTQLEKFGIILSSDLGNQRTVDVHPQLTSSNATALLATDGGSVYKCTFAEGSKFM